MEVNDYLFSLKIFPNNKGYLCVKACLSELLKNPGAKIANVYRAVSARLGYSAKAVEQNIIYAIENAWLKADVELLRGEFGNTVLETKCKPTCKQFLVTLADKFSAGR